ncbi:HEAT repeat domain-containing protein [Natronobeatus ordinarius]|uniref:HEAT repeat domain-containing protein n=1 Tax=Natronobeatus ordinarius TaxID=2963433 RepID=UPI0020CF1762|nr:HEAT repeat domain-containing protein [Natronobeatus ordinarius]
MPGDGNRRVAWGASEPSDELHLPSILAKLDATDEDVQLEAVRTIRTALEEEPRRCVPTVPKLRQLLERAPTGFDELVVSCLAELAAEAPNDVAPSVDAVVQFVRAETPHPGTTDALRCLAHVAERRPDPVVDHVADVVAVLEADERIDPWGTRLLETLSTSHPRAIDPATPLLETALEREPETHGPAALAALARLARAEPARVATFLEAVKPLVEHDEPALRVAAIDRLRDVVEEAPASATEPASTSWSSTLERLADTDPSDDVRDRAEHALVVVRRTGVRTP